MRVTYTSEAPAGYVSVIFEPRKDSFLRDGSPAPALVVGYDPEKAPVTRRRLIPLVRKAVRLAKEHSLKNISLDLAALPDAGLARPELVRLLATEALLADFEFVRFRTAPPEGWPWLAELALVGPVDPAAEEASRTGSVVGGYVNACRDLANTPGGEMTPALLAAAAQKLAEGLPVRVEILDREKMQGLGMGGILGVSQGSDAEPKFIILEYKGAEEKPLVLVGKGVTFDTGGLNLKPSEHIYEMHMDMSGGAAVIAAVAAAAKLGLKRRVIALVPAAENMPSGSSFRPGDILRSMSGQTIEVKDTDAEGRILLADALAYAKGLDPALVVDVATLTGSAVAALGDKASAVFTPDDSLAARLRELGEESGDYVWQLPLWEEYEDDVRGTFGDWANVERKQRHGGAIAGAVFLRQFAKDFPWAHIDMAPRMTPYEEEFLAKGAAGAPVRLLLKLIEKGVSN